MNNAFSERLKMKEFIKKHEKLFKVLAILGIFALISLISAVILYLCGFLYFNEAGDLSINENLFVAFKDSWYGYVIVVLADIAVTSLLSFVPAISMAFIMLITTLYTNKWIAFAISFAGVLITSFMLYILGRFGGYALGKKVLGEEDCEKASELLNNKGLIFFPLMMMLPVFPDDALTMVAGTLKMSLKWFVPSIVIGRGIGVTAIVFGLSLFDFSTFEWWHWVLFISACAIGIALLFFCANKLNNYLASKNKEENLINSAEDNDEDNDEEIELNDKNAQVILDENRYPNGANSPTRHIEYTCPCGKGKIIDERVVGFGDYYAYIECKRCEKKYEVVTGMGYIWELKEKETANKK